MKKIISMIVLFVMLAMVVTTVANAATNSSLADDLYSVGSKYGMTSADKLKIERYLADNPVTNDQANTVLAKAQEAAKVMDDAGVKDIKSLSDEQKSKIQTLANDAASTVGLTLSFKSGAVEIYKDGKLLDTVTSTNGKLVYTGNSINVVAIVISAVAVVALATTTCVVRKKIVNA
jgi:hypothetical protein